MIVKAFASRCVCCVLLTALYTCVKQDKAVEILFFLGKSGARARALMTLNRAHTFFTLRTVYVSRVHAPHPHSARACETLSESAGQI